MFKTICDFCGRDITDHDRFMIQFNPGKRDVLKRQYGQWDVCVSCARKLDPNKLLIDETSK